MIHDKWVSSAGSYVTKTPRVRAYTLIHTRWFEVGGLGFEFACSSPVGGMLFGVSGLLLLLLFLFLLCMLPASKDIDIRMLYFISDILTIIYVADSYDYPIS